MSEWIDLKQQMPPDLAVVLVCTRYLYQAVCCYRHAYTYKFLTHNGIHVTEVTHWKILDWPAAVPEGDNRER